MSIKYITIFNVIISFFIYFLPFIKISEFNKMTEKHQIEIKTKIMAILNELDIRPLEIGFQEEY